MSHRPLSGAQHAGWANHPEWATERGLHHVSAGDIHALLHPGDFVPREDKTHHDMWLGKQHAALDSGLAEQVHDEGVQEPVWVSGPKGLRSKPTLVDGHHRIAAALAADPDMKVPVQTWDKHQTDEMLNRLYERNRAERERAA